MKFSVFTDMLGADSFREALQIARQLGFACVDLRAGLDGDSIDTIAVEKARELRQALDEQELEVGSISSWAVNSCTFSGPPKYDNYDEGHHERMSVVFARLCDLADAFGAQLIRIYPLHRQEGFDQLPDAEKDAQYRHNAAMLVRHAEQAARRNKTVLVENEPPTLANTARELGLLIKYANHPNLRINWDIVNEWRAGSYPTVESYAHIRGYVYQTHLKGAVRVPGSTSAEKPGGKFQHFAIAGQDDFDHTAIMKAIAASDPQALMTIDTHFPHLDEADRQLGAVEVMRRTKSYLESLV